jgi:GT2 family glycosyltransferase/glycosyltransferase involved in cell wall biosynthesis
MDLTALIITKNAEDTLEKTLRSVLPLTRTILVIDDYSTDDTKNIALRYGCTVKLHHSYDLGIQREYALAQVETEWVLVLDADECLSPELIAEIKNINPPSDQSGYFLQLRNHLFGKPLMHGELHRKMILFRTASASINPAPVHEAYTVTGKTGILRHKISHYSYRTLPQIYGKFYDYAKRQALIYKRDNVRYGLKELLVNPLHMFVARYFVDNGYKDGIVPRLVLDLGFALMEFCSYAFIPFVRTKVRVAIDSGAYFREGIVQSGIDRLLQGIDQYHSSSYEYYWFGFHVNSQRRLFPWLFSQVWLPLAVIWYRADVFLGTSGTIPLLLRYFPIRKIVFLHDFGFYKHPEKYKGSSQKLQLQTNTSARVADRIIVFHKTLYDECIERFPQYAYKVRVINAGADHLEKLSPIPLSIEKKKPLILYVGVVKPIKRIELLLEAVGNTYFVIAGPKEDMYAYSIGLHKKNNVQHIDNFNDAQLKWLYKQADIMVYASAQEGFCYPVLEALLEGIPVVAFRLPLFEDYQKYFPHLYLVDTVDEMKKLLTVKHPKTLVASHSHPLTWQRFHDQLSEEMRMANESGPTLTESERCKIGFICVLYKTKQADSDRIRKEIENMGIQRFELYFIDNTHNGKGYAAGINEGIRKGLIDGCDYFMAINPDISFGPLKRNMIADTVAHFDVWGFGMRQDGVVYYGGEIDTWRLSGGLIQKKPATQFNPVDFVSGSILGFSRDVVEKIGLWDETYFMYYEDVDYCERARRAGFRVGINSAVVYDHFEVSKTNARKQKWIARSRWMFFWRFASITQKIREIIRLPKTFVESTL